MSPFEESEECMQMHFPLKGKKKPYRTSQSHPKRMVCSTWLPWEPGVGTRAAVRHDCYTALDSDLGAGCLSPLRQCCVVGPYGIATLLGPQFPHMQH